MTIEQQLASTFAAHEHLAPDADRLLADLRDELVAARRRPGRRRVTAALAAAAAVAALAGVAVFVDRLGDRAPTDPVSGSTRVVTPLLHVRPGWLPAGSVLDQSMAGAGLELRMYRKGVLPSGHGVAVGVGRRRQAAPPRRVGGTTSVHDVKIAGRAAREYSGRRYFEIDVRLGSGLSGFVYVEPVSDVSAITAGELARTGRRVAASLTYDAADTVPAAVTFTSLPPGVAIEQIDAGGGEVDYSLALPKSAGGHGALAIGTGNYRVTLAIAPEIKHGSGTALPPLGGMSGRRWQTDRGQLLVYRTTGVRPRELWITGAPGAAALRQLKAIAARLRWPQGSR